MMDICFRLMFKWTSNKERPSSGSLVKLETKKFQTETTPV